MMQLSLSSPFAASLAAVLLVLAGVAFPRHAVAVEALSASELGALCATESVDTDTETAATLCRIYVLGFLEGAIATDPRVAMGVAEQIERDNSFQARAYRTRLGRDLERLGPSHLAGFCVPKKTSLGAVVTRVVVSLPDMHADEAAGELVYRVLRSNYPCDTVEQ